MNAEQSLFIAEYWLISKLLVIFSLQALTGILYAVTHNNIFNDGNMCRYLQDYHCSYLTSTVT